MKSGQARKRVTQLNEHARRLCQRGKHASAIELAVEARDLARREIGRDSLACAEALEILAEIHRATDRCVKAATLLRRALAIKERKLGEDDPRVAATCDSLAGVYKVLGDYPLAEAGYARAVASRRAALGPDHPLVARSLNNLSDLYRRMGKYAAALPLQREAERIFRSALGESHPDRATSLNNLALLHRLLGHYEDAESLYLEVLEIDRVALGEDHPDYATDQNNLADVYHCTGRLAEAERLYRQSAEIRRRHLGKSHPDYADSLTNLAALLAATGREAQALTYAEQAVAIDDRRISQVFRIESESQRLAFLATFQGRLDLYLSLVHQYFRECPQAVNSAFRLAQRRRLVKAAATESKRDAVLGLKHPEVRSLLQQLLTLRMQTVDAAFSAPDGDAPAEDPVSELREFGRRLEEDVALYAPERRAWLQARQSEREVIQTSLPRGARLLDHIRFNLFDFSAVPASGQPRWHLPRYLAFASDQRDPEAVRLFDVGEAAALERKMVSQP